MASRALLNATPIEQDVRVFESLGWQVELMPRAQLPNAPSEAIAAAARVADSIPADSHVLIGGSSEYCEELALRLLKKKCQLYSVLREDGQAKAVKELAISVAWRTSPFLNNDGVVGGASVAPVHLAPAAAAPAGLPAAPSVSAAPISSVVRIAPTTPLPPPVGVTPIRALRTKGQILVDIESSVRGSGNPNSGRISELKRELDSIQPGLTAEADKRIQNGLRDHKRMQELYQLAKKNGEGDPEVQRRLKEIVKRFGYLAKAAHSYVKRGEAERTGAGPVALSSVRAQGDHRICNLLPSKAWTLLIDETGADFVTGADKTLDPRQKGKFVGILIADEHRLAPLPIIFHATGKTPDAELDKHMQALLDSPAGVFGLTIDELPAGFGDRWLHGVQEIVHWTFRLLPLQARKSCKLQVLIEQRGVHIDQSDWSATAAEMLRHYSEADPDRAACLMADIKVVKKDTHPALGYADLVSFTWGSPSRNSQARLHQSGLLGNCLQEGNSAALRKDWDLLAKGRRLEGSAWRALLAGPDSKISESITATILFRLQEACRKDFTLWKSYLDASHAHLESKAVDLRAMGTELRWLDGCRPIGAAFPDPVQLTWLTIQLAQANHLGETEFVQEKELEGLAGKLLDEDARLVCLADLHRAVSQFNRYDFVGAENALLKWKAYPPSVPGLQMWGRIQGSLGQAVAFQGRYAEALDYFLQAFGAFEKLSGKDLGELEKRHTGGYWAVAAMDDVNIGLNEVVRKVSYVTGDIAVAIPQLSRSSRDSDKFAHHLLLRFLVHRGLPEQVEAYLGHRDAWGAGVGHPWPLIECYRAILLREKHPEIALDRLCAGIDMCLGRGQGPRDGLIGAALSVIAHHWGREWLEAEDVFRQLESDMPNASEQIHGLKTMLDSPQIPKLILARALPFRFR